MQQNMLVEIWHRRARPWARKAGPGVKVSGEEEVLLCCAEAPLRDVLTKPQACLLLTSLASMV